MIALLSNCTTPIAVLPGSTKYYPAFHVGMYVKPYEMKPNHVLIITVWKR